MYEYYDEYLRAKNSSDVDAQTRWARQLTWEVARHAVGEEIVVYPLMEKHMGESGLKLANEGRSAHQVNTLLQSRPCI
jgi:hemerythrin superfamily protein